MAERYSDTQKRITKESVFLALMKLMAAKSFHELSVTEITKKAGVSRAAFYRNYETKEDIVRFYLRDLFSECLEQIRRLDEKNKYNRIRLFFSFFQDNGEYINTLACDDLSPIFYQELLPYMKEFFETDADTDTADAAYTRYLTQYISSGICRVLFAWIGEGMKESADDMAGFVFAITRR